MVDNFLYLLNLYCRSEPVVYNSFVRLISELRFKFDIKRKTPNGIICSDNFRNQFYYENKFWFNSKDKINDNVIYDNLYINFVCFPIHFILMYSKFNYKSVEDLENTFIINFFEEDNIQFRWKLFNYGKGLILCK